MAKETLVIALLAEVNLPIYRGLEQILAAVSISRRINAAEMIFLGFTPES